MNAPKPPALLNDEIALAGPGRGAGRLAFGGRSSLAVAVIGVVAALCWSYAPNLAGLVQLWASEPNYSHGFFVIPIALFVFWKRRPESLAVPPTGARWGWAILGAALILRGLSYERGMAWLETATLLPCVAGLILACGGWPLVRRAWPAVAYLVFMLPLPARANADLSVPLQRLATVGSCALLRLSGLWVMSEGNIIYVGSQPLEVATVCNGLSMLLSLAALVAAATILVPMPVWKRVVLLVSIIPIALVCNVLRITATAWCYHSFGAEVGGRYAHDAAGWLMMPAALLFVWLELAILALRFGGPGSGESAPLPPVLRYGSPAVRKSGGDPQAGPLLPAAKR